MWREEVPLGDWNDMDLPLETEDFGGSGEEKIKERNTKIRNLFSNKPPEVGSVYSNKCAIASSQ